MFIFSLKKDDHIDIVITIQFDKHFTILHKTNYIDSFYVFKN